MKSIFAEAPQPPPLLLRDAYKDVGGKDLHSQWHLGGQVIANLQEGSLTIPVLATSADFNGGLAKETLIRTCGYLGGDTQKTTDYRSYGNSKSEVTTCFKDECNSASNFSLSFLMIFSVMYGFILCAYNGLS